jgi:imidazolonepropionase-like amidohydrolase
MLRSGWTTVRILGDADVAYAHFDVRTAIQEGLFSGPRLTGAGHYFSITGGGGDLNFIAPEHQVAGDGLVVDGVDAVRKAVREENDRRQAANDGSINRWFRRFGRAPVGSAP